MLSRLSGLANTVLQELSGEGEDAEATTLQAGPELETGQQNGEETPEDVLERLAHMERLVAQLKDLVREKDAQLQQKEALLQEEKQAAEAKLLKLKLQAKAKLASLNKRIEELTEQGEPLPATDPARKSRSPAKVQRDRGTQEEQAEGEAEGLRRHLQEKEEMVAKLQEKLEEAAGNLSKAQSQLSVLQEEVLQKDAHIEDLARQHQAEVQQLRAQSALEAGMQQDLKLLQRTLEEQEVALVGRMQVVELLQHELNSTQQEKQTLSEKFQKAQAKLESLRSTLASERQDSRGRVERLELELAEQKLAGHRLQEEAQRLSEELAQARAVQADRDPQRHSAEAAEKDQEAGRLQSGELGCPLEHAAGNGAPRKGELFEGPDESGCLPAEPEVPTGEDMEQVSVPSESVAEPGAAASPKSGVGQEEEQRQKNIMEAPATENEPLCCEVAAQDKSLELAADAAEGRQKVTDVELQTQPASGQLLDLGDRSSGPGFPDTVEFSSAEGLHASGSPAPLVQGGRAETLLAAEDGPTDVLEYLSLKKRKDLSALLLELQEAQEEIAFLKGQLQDPNNMGTATAGQTGGEPQAGGEMENAEERAGLTQGESSSSSLTTVETREGSLLLPGTPLGQDTDKEATLERARAPPLDSEEPAKLRLEIAALRSSQQAAEERHQSALEERTAEIKRLQQLLEDSGGAVCALRAEREQLLSQLQELGALAELKERVKQLEGGLADAERQRLSDYEDGASRLGLLKEQIQSLENEARSKEVKIAALQKDLDEAQHLLSEEGKLGRTLSVRLQEGEQETRAVAEKLQQAAARAEELSRSLLAKEAEAARLQQLLAESSAEGERLRQEVAEREQRMAELSLGMSNRMVQLNEEKFLLGKELQSLAEQLSLRARERETRDAAAGTEEAASPAAEELLRLRGEHELVRKKLQAALVSRKELLGRVRTLESELEGGRGGPPKPRAVALEAQEPGGDPAPPKSSLEAREAAAPARRGRSASLSQLLPAEEPGPRGPPGTEEDSAGAALRAVIQGLQQSLREKDLHVAALQARLRDPPLAPDDQALPDRNSEGSETAAPVTRAGGSGAEEKSPGEELRAALEERVGALEQGREQHQKQLQEALAAQEEAVARAQEEARVRREELQQQQRDRSALQEQLEQQRREKEALLAQLRALREAQGKSLLLGPAAVAPPETPALETEREPAGEVPAERDAADAGFQASEASAAEQLEARLKKLQAEKGELEAQKSQLNAELRKASEAAVRRQAQTEQLSAELDAAKAACGQAEARVLSLQRELGEREAEVARQESSRLHQRRLEEQEHLASREEIQNLNSQLADKNESLHGLQAELQEREKAIRALQEQLEAQSKERAQPLQAEGRQRSAGGASEEPAKSQLQRKLQAALISRKDALKESKVLREDLAGAQAALHGASVRLSEAEAQAAALGKEKEALLEKLAALQEEREKLIAEVDKALVENQSVSGSCESLKLALEAVTQEKVCLEEQVDSLQRSQAQELSAWQGKHQELQAEYETLLQSYENVSNEAERVQRLVEGVRQEKQELFLRLRDAEAQKREADARLQGAEQEMEGMREKMRKFAKSKQQKILELEEENERLRTELHPAEGGPGRAEGSLAGLREELESAKKNSESLSSQLEVLVAEKASLTQEIQDLKQMLQGKGEEAEGASGQPEVAAGSVTAVSPVAEPLEQAEVQAPVGATPEPTEPAAGSPTTNREEVGKDELNSYIQQVTGLAERVSDLEEKRRVAAEELSQVLRDVEALAEEKKVLQELLAVKDQELGALREKVSGLEEAGRQVEELRAEGAKLKAALESEKDDLEERLMNQLAELNGSIGNYQQDAVELQRRNQDLAGEVAALREALRTLETEKQNLQKKAEAAAEKKEEMEKLRSPWKEGGGRTQAKELQELLKAKQQEVRQLQKDCIKSQEKTSSLERTVKALEFVQSESQKDLEAARRSSAKAEEDAKRARSELASVRVLLDDTQSELARVLAEGLKVKEELQASKARAGAQLKQKEKELDRRLEQEQEKHAKEMRNAEERLQALQRERARAEEAAQESQNSLRRKDQEAKELQSSLNQTLAQLAAFTRSMSSLQDDRDRVIEESRRWEQRLSEAAGKKEQEVLRREEACAGLERQAKELAAQVEELRSQVASLEQSNLAEESRFQKELLCQQEEVESVQEEKKKLLLQLEEAQQLLRDSRTLVQKQQVELQELRGQLVHLQDALAQCDKSREEKEQRVKGQEADLQECRFRCEQLGADLQASKRLTDHLHEELSSKEQQIISLVAAKEEAVAATASELQLLHKEELRLLESRMEKLEEGRAALEAEKTEVLATVDRLTGKLKGAQEESRQHRAQLDSFTKSMSSLQDDRERILGEYQQLEQRHLAAILEKDQLIQEAAAENNTLKEQLRGLHGRLDDLHAENAKLGAERLRHREDLQQLLSIKDCQQKQLLSTQLQRIQELEREKAAAESRLRESESLSARLRQSVEDLQLERSGVGEEAEALRASLSQAQDEVAALRAGGPVLELQGRLQAKADEAQELSGRLALRERQVEELQGELALLRQSTSQKIHEAEDKMKKELKSLHHDAGLMRNETETAEERVAELARDLLEMEQSLLAVTEENQDLKAQIQSFGKAMSSLQDSWDQSNEALRAMEKKYSVDLEEQRRLVQRLAEEKALLEEEQAKLAKQREALASELEALQKLVEEKGLLLQLDSVRQELQGKETEVVRLTSELEEAAGQVKSFSKAMASLQDERDRLLGELDKARKADELKLQSEASVSARAAEVASLKKSLSSLQNDRDRLLSELKNLQQQYLQAGVDTGEMTRLKAQLQEQKEEAEQQRHILEQLKEENASWQLQLQQLREERAAWQGEASSAKDQTQRAARERVEKQSLTQAAPAAADSREALKPGQEADAQHLQAQLKSCLKELHQKEMRIQQLNTKLSQVFEEKNSLAVQLRGSSRHLRESHQSYSQVLARCEALEKQLQGLQPLQKDAGSLPTDAAPGAPQERNEHPRESYTPELQELQMRLSEAEQQQSSAKQNLRHLEEMLQEEQDRRLAAEEALAAAQDRAQRLEASDWSHSLDTSIEIPASAEHALLLAPAEGSFSKARGGLGLQRVLRSLVCSRRRLPLLGTVYLLTVHVLLFLCLTGHL